MSAGLDARLKGLIDQMITQYSPIYTAALRGVNVAEDNDIANISFDGHTFFYNTTFVLNNQDDMLSYMMMHDSLHLICGHPFDKFATNPNKKVRQRFYEKSDTDVAAVMHRMQFPIPACIPQYKRDEVISGGDHLRWPNLETIITQYNWDFSPWLKVTVKHETDVAKELELRYNTISHSGHRPFYGYQNIEQTTRRAFTAVDENGAWHVATKHNVHVRELLDIFVKLAGKLSI